ncbi:hypothetical protein [Paraferrimonas haliotis]|uniref:Uncharacterized protein n=1 Tax=Paraferrimonas haliotis TaxID=2013866 RepID=A0AA37TLX6_9GAMM|nr:hypothetical protein [Paraferrimonas haliotis]GLS83744.1 hypothetical protein GCM10007894_17210 [Paraferrimonas haliotis]
MVYFLQQGWWEPLEKQKNGLAGGALRKLVSAESARDGLRPSAGVPALRDVRPPSAAL